MRSARTPFAVLALARCYNIWVSAQMRSAHARTPFAAVIALALGITFFVTLIDKWVGVGVGVGVAIAHTV